MIMEEQLKFIEGGFPLVNRVWIEIDENSTRTKVIEFIRQYVSTMIESLTLEVHFYVKSTSEESNNNLIDCIKEAYQFKVGYEKSFPIVSIFYPYKSLDDKILSRINECDTYRPGIKLYVLATDNDVPKEKSLSEMRIMAEELYDKVQRSQSIGIDSTLFLYLENDTQKLEQLFEIRRLAFTWDTSSSMKKPLLQVAPNLKIGKSEVEKLSKYIKKEDGLDGILDTLCGFTSLLYRYNENKSVPTEYVPLGGCGAGVSEKKLCSNGSITSCFFLSEDIIGKDAFEKCKKCSHVSNCTGCILKCTSHENCELKDIFDVFVSLK